MNKMVIVGWYVKKLLNSSCFGQCSSVLVINDTGISQKHSAAHCAAVSLYTLHQSIN